MNVFENICRFLAENKILYRTVHHKPAFTSEDSATARGEDVKIGGKAILMKIDDSFKIFVLSAALKIDSKKIKTYFNAKNIRFASKEELLDLTGLVPGSVPPFGKPILDFELFVDESISQNEKIAFNAGSPTDSIIMTTRDYFFLCGGKIINFSQR